MNHGFIASKIIIEEQYILGDGFFRGSVLMSNGHGWEKWLPEKELQNRNGLETMGCTNYAVLNAIEAVGKKKFGAEFQNNLSERYTGIMTGNTTQGNDPHKVCEIIRTQCGVIPEVFLPFDSTINEWSKYYSPNPISYILFSIGRHWLQKYDLRHSWAFTDYLPLKQKQDAIKFALRFSPVTVAGFAWSQHSDGLYYSDQPYKNHYFVIYDYVDNKKWLVLDTYDNVKKELDWNFDFAQGKYFSLSKRNYGSIKSSYLSYGVYLLGSYVKEIIK